MNAQSLRVYSNLYICLVMFLSNKFLNVVEVVEVCRCASHVDVCPHAQCRQSVRDKSEKEERKGPSDGHESIKEDVPKIVDDEVLYDLIINLFNVMEVPEVVVAVYRCEDKVPELVDSKNGRERPAKYAEHRQCCPDPIHSHRPIQLFFREIIRQ